MSENDWGAIQILVREKIERWRWLDGVEPEKFVDVAVRNSPEQCPLALAVKDRGGDRIARASVPGDRIEVEFTNGKKDSLTLGADLMEAVRRFDETGVWKVEPLPGVKPLPGATEKGKGLKVAAGNMATTPYKRAA